MPIATTSAPGVSMKLPNATDGIPTEVCSGLLNDTASPSKLYATPLENGSKVTQMPLMDTDNQRVRKRHTETTETTERVASKEILSVSSVSSVWDKKGTQMLRKSQKGWHQER